MKNIKKFSILFLSLLTVGCTYNVSQAHTEGTATDVVDTNQSAKPKVNGAINVPVKSDAPINVEVPPTASK